MTIAMNPIIKPDVINILSREPLPVRKVITEVQPQLQPKRSFWGKVRGFFKKAWVYITSAITLLSSATIAVSRYKDATRRSNARNEGMNAKGDQHG